ncbi:MAG: phosphatase PAP2 family protein [Clostridia bacterium]|nr:phosphatase PAP2 family protein [Clostridia bacterium]
MSKRAKLIIIISCLALYVACVTLATFFDYQISQAIAKLPDGEYISNSLFGKIFEVIGESPMYLAGAFASAILLRRSFKIQENVVKSILMTLCAVVGIVILTVMITRAVEYVFEQNHKLDAFEEYKSLITLIVAVVSAGCFALITLGTFKIPEKHIAGLTVFAVAVFMAAVMAQVPVQGVKVLVGRQRYRAINVLEYNGLNEFVKYTEWFVINGKQTPSEEMLALGIATDAYKSFPSGHTCAWAVIYCFALVPDFLEIDEKTRIKAKTWLLVGATLSTLVLGYTRILVGAHFATDVLLSAGWTYFSVVISAFICKKIFKMK